VRFTALSSASLLSGSSFFQNMQHLLTTPFLPPTFLPPTWVALEPSLGKVVKEEIKRLQKQGVRNSQSAIDASAKNPWAKVEARC
jgi:hypothetical protein